MLETSRRLQDLDATREAIERGELSVEQASEVAAAAGQLADSGRAQEAIEAERSLLDVAGRGNFGALRTAAEQARQAARDEQAQREHLRKTRFFPKRRFDDGGIGGAFKLEPGVAAQVYAVLDAEAERQFRLARGSARRDGHDACAADALVQAIVGDQGQAGGAGTDVTQHSAERRVEMLVRVDLAALYRGRPMAGETCEIAGVGPVPVDVIRELLGEALVTLVLHDGVDVINVTCGARRAAKALRIAVLERDGHVCTDCGTPYGLELDHTEPFASTRHTRYDELRPRCRRCHGEKTRTEAAITIRAGRERAMVDAATRARFARLLAEHGRRPPPDLPDRHDTAAVRGRVTGTDPPLGV